jgi:hypothetical protein
MVESVKSPTIEELLERIARLEHKTAELQAQLDDLGGAFNKDLEDTTEHFSNIYQRLNDYVWPLVHKVFPGYAPAMEQSDAILKRCSSDEGKQRR